MTEFISATIAVDSEACQGYGNCILIAPELFEVAEDGRARVRHALIGSDYAEAARMAMYDCPTQAISMTAADAGS